MASRCTDRPGFRRRRMWRLAARRHSRWGKRDRISKEVGEMKGTKSWLVKWALRLSYGVSILTIALPARAFATVTGGGTLPWDPTLNTLQNDLQGTVAHTVTTAAIIGTGISWAVSEHGTGVRKMSAVAFGGAAALGATTLMTALFPIAGALF